MDGNKRTALVCALNFLRMNGYFVDVSNELMYEIAISVANNRLSKSDLVDWFRDHITPIDIP